MNTQLLFGIHCHQPYNNFFDIIEKATEKSYYPFLKILSEFKNVKIAVHYSGWLFEWIKKNRKDLFNLIKKLFDNGQIEIFTSGFYEPILAAIPEEDAILQIEKSNKFIKDNFGIEPEGLWLTERVWDNKIVQLLVNCGIKYVTVDDYHFISAGFNKDKLQGYYITEEDGYKLGIFPISKDLRYAIPFKEINEVSEFLKDFNIAIIFDDGEKFGWWPHTYEWVYEKNWLYYFFDFISSSRNIETRFYKEFFENNLPSGRVYLPIASYFEMGEWSLDYESSKLFQKYYNKLKDEYKLDENILLKFFKGGIWKNFLIKYEEANNIHKKMLKVSKRVKNKSLNDEITDWLLKAQCNDCLWHGVFGGIYLPNLRDNSYIALNHAEKFLSYGDKNYFDFNYDGYNELELRNNNLIVMVSEKNGAQVFEFSDLNSGFNLLNTLTRRKETYHDEIINSEIEENDINEENVKTIHEIRYKVTREIKEALKFDDYLKYSFIDLIVDRNFNNIGNFNEEFFYNEKSNQFEKSGNITILSENFHVKFIKKYQLDDKRLICNYKIINQSAAFFDLRHVIEINMYFPGGEYINVNEKEFKILDEFEDINTNRITIFDNVLNKFIEIACDNYFNLKCSPIITISKNEKEYEKTYQGTTFMLVFPFDLKFKENREFFIEINIK